MRFEDRATLNILSKTSGSVFLLLSSIIMVRVLSRNDYGTFLQLMLVVNTALMLVYFGLPQSIYYFYPRADDKICFLKNTFFISLLISFLASFFLYFITPTFSLWFDNERFGGYGLFIALMVFFQGQASFREPILIALDRLVLNSLLTFVSVLVTYVPSFIAIYLGCDLGTLIYVYLGSAVCNYMLFVFAIFYVLKCCFPFTKFYFFSRSNIKIVDQIKYSFPVGLSSCVGVLGRQIDKYIISLLFTPAQFAVFSRGAMEVPLIGNVTYTLNAVSMSRYVEYFKDGQVARYLSLFRDNIDKVAKINFCFFSYLIYRSDYLVVSLYTDEYIDAVPVFQVYLFLLLHGITVYGSIPRVVGSTRQLTFASLINLLVNVFFSLALIPQIGAVGAAVGTILGSFAYALFLLFCAKRDLNVAIRDIIPWGRLFVIFLSSCLSVAISHFFLEFVLSDVMDDFLSFFVGGLLYVYLYLLILLNLGYLSVEERNYFSRWARFDVFRYIPKISL